MSASVHCLFVLAWQPPEGQGLLIHEVSRSHTTTYHSLYESSGRVISSSQRTLRDNTQHTKQLDTHAPGGIWTQNIIRRAVVDLRLRQRSHWDRSSTLYGPEIFHRCMLSTLVHRTVVKGFMDNVRLKSLILGKRLEIKPRCYRRFKII
jgi:hypothetical protein